MSKLFTLIAVVAVAVAAFGVFTLATNNAWGSEASPFEAGLPATVNADGDNGGRGLRFEADLTGAQEVPEVMTDMTGEIRARFDEGFTQVEVKLEVSDIPGGVEVEKAHFHCGRPGRNGPVVFGLVAPGPLAFEFDEDEDEAKVEGILTNADFNNADCVPHIDRPVNNIVALAFAMRDGLIYANVHTDANPGGEIRGQMLEE